MAAVRLLVAALAACTLARALQLPSYVQPCSRSDPALDECAVRNGQLALSSIIKGDKTYRIPPLNPLHIPLISIGASDNLKITIKDSEISGLEDTVVQRVHMDTQKQRFTFVVHIPRANLLGEYTINGRILILPIQGQGPANITFERGTYTYDMDYALVDRDGVEYAQVGRNSIEYETGRAHYSLQNLFNGDANLGAEMNRFLNENWQQVSKDLGPAISETISQIITTILSSILAKVPFSEFLTD